VVKPTASTGEQAASSGRQLSYAEDADGARGRKLELEHFLIEQGVDICHLNETHL
jgi:hypothetical protein